MRGVGSDDSTVDHKVFSRRYPFGPRHHLLKKNLRLFIDQRRFALLGKDGDSQMGSFVLSATKQRSRRL
jgi:hypothetical protein